MSCCECEELIATAARDGRTLEAAAEHLSRCGACREFARHAAAAAEALAGWEVPVPAGPAADAVRAALAERLATRRAGVAGGRQQRSRSTLIEPQYLLGVVGALAAAAGVAMAPDWVRLAVACWVGLAALLASLVLVQHSQGDAGEGEL